MSSPVASCPKPEIIRDIMYPMTDVVNQCPCVYMLVIHNNIIIIIMNLSRTILQRCAPMPDSV